MTTERPDASVSPRNKTPSIADVVDRELPVLYRVARRLTRDPQAAEDLVGTALYQAAKAWSSFDGRHPRSWMIRILRNEFLATKRRESTRPIETELEDSEIAWVGNVFNLVLEKMTTEDILREVDTLSEDARLVVALTDIEGLSYDEVAESLDIPIGTVRSRLFRARKQLQARLSQHIQP